MISGKCIVSGAYRKGEWPEVFANVPAIDTYVLCGSSGLELKVVKVVHATKHVVKLNRPTTIPFIIVYLEG